MEYIAPTSFDDAFAALDCGGVSVVAGGTDWFPSRGDAPLRQSVVDITGLPGLRGISRQAGGWRIGAGTSWSDLIRADLPPIFDGLKAAAREVGSVQVQNAGTLGGNLCNASPAADGVPPLLTLRAEVELVSARGTRRLALEAFLTGVRETALRPGELLAAIHLPHPPEGMTAGFRKLGARRYLVISIAMAAVAVRVEAGRIAEARVAVGACSPVAQRLPGYEAALRGCDASAALPAPDAGHFAALAPISDMRADAAYRLEAASVLCRRTLAAALEDVDA